MKPVLDFFLYVMLGLFEKLMVGGIHYSMFCKYGWKTISKQDDINWLGSCRASRLYCAVICNLRPNCTVFAHDLEGQKCFMGEESSMLSEGNATVPVGTYYRLVKTSIEGWCPISDGYQLLADGGPCVKFFTGFRTWLYANRTCAGFSPSCRLAVLDTQHKNELVKKAAIAIDEHVFSISISIGLSNHSGNGFQWVDGTRLSFADWGKTKKKKKHPDKICVRISRSKWRWTKSDCSKKVHFVCEVVLN